MSADRYLCRCRQCKEEGQFVSRRTYQRHSNRTDPPPPPSSALPMLTEALDGGNNEIPSPGGSPDPIAIPQTVQTDSISHIRDLLSQKRANFEFPPSLVFTTPPTKDSNHYQPRADTQLLVPNSYHPISLVDNDSAAVVNYECLLVEHLNVLNALPLQDGHISASEVGDIKTEILGTLRYLDRKRGNEWNQQLCAQINPSTFIISGENQLSH